MVTSDANQTEIIALIGHRLASARLLEWIRQTDCMAAVVVRAPVATDPCDGAALIQKLGVYI